MSVNIPIVAPAGAASGQQHGQRHLHGGQRDGHDAEGHGERDSERDHYGIQQLGVGLEAGMPPGTHL